MKFLQSRERDQATGARYFDGDTRVALAAWQRERGLPPSGVFGPLSREVMMAETTAVDDARRLVRTTQQQVPFAPSVTPGGVAGTLLGLFALVQLKSLLTGGGGDQEVAPGPSAARSGGPGSPLPPGSSIRLPPLPPKRNQKLQYGGGSTSEGAPSPFGSSQGGPARGKAASKAAGGGATLAAPPNLRSSGVWFVDTNSSAPLPGAGVVLEKAEPRAEQQVAAEPQPPKQAKRWRRWGKPKVAKEEDREREQAFASLTRDRTTTTMPPPRRTREESESTEPEPQPQPQLSTIQQKYAGALERVRQRRNMPGNSDLGGASPLPVKEAGEERVFSISSLQKKVTSLNDTVETLSGREGRLEELQAQVDSLETILKIGTDAKSSALSSQRATAPDVAFPGSGGTPPRGFLDGDNFERLRKQLVDISSAMDERVASMLQESNEVLEKRLQHVEHQLEKARTQSKKREQLLNTQIERLEGIADQKLQGSTPSDKQLGWFGVLGALLGYAASTSTAEQESTGRAGGHKGVLDNLFQRIQDVEDKVKAETGSQSLVDIDERLKALEDAWTAPPSAEVITAEPAVVEPPRQEEPRLLDVAPPKIDTSVMLWRLDHGREILLQGFHWESHNLNWYDIIREKVPEIKSAGFSGVWFPPPSDSIAPQGYLPRDLYNLNTKYGSMEQLKRVISCMGEYELHPMADIVINHRCATTRGAGGKWNRWDGTKMGWDERAICRDNHQFGGQGNNKSGDDFTAAPNIDHSQDFVREDLKGWLKWLLSEEVGFKSLRFDFTKGYSGQFVGEYVEACRPEFSVGEFWETCNYGGDGTLSYNQDHHRQRVVDWCDQAGGKSAAFDFTTKGILQEAVGRNELWRLVDTEGRPPGVMGVWPSHAVTFLDNHDTGSTQAHWPFPADKILMGYAYILTHPGTPSVFWDHLFDWGSEVSQKICELVALRRKKDIHSRSKVKIVEAKDNLYAAYVDNKLAVKVGQGSWSPATKDGWVLESSGNGFAVWTKG